jgi:hypothetical protein
MACSSSTFGRFVTFRSITALVFILAACTVLFMTMELVSFSVNLSRKVSVVFKTQYLAQELPQMDDSKTKVFKYEIQWIFAESDQNPKISSNLENLTESLLSMEENITSNSVQIASPEMFRETLQSHAKLDAPRKIISASQGRRSTALPPEEAHLTAQEQNDAAPHATQIRPQTAQNLTAGCQELQRANQTRFQQVQNQTAAFPLHPPGPRCENGVDMGSRRRFWAYHDGERPRPTP